MVSVHSFCLQYKIYTFCTASKKRARPWKKASIWLQENSEIFNLIYHTSNSRECMGVNGEALQLHAVYKKPYFVMQITRESVSVLQVT